MLRARPAVEVSRRPGLRTLASALALLTLLSPLLGALHDGTVAHVTCAEHGELVEAGSAERQRAASSPHQHQASGVLLSESDSRGGQRFGEHHEHCIVAAQSRVRATAASTRAASVALVARAVASSEVPQAPALHPQAIYRLAPKSSPPA
jgi:hypothetical protein